jgi:hypothetical protein
LWGFPANELLAKACRHGARWEMAKVLLACHHNMIQAFSADRANQALHTTILPRRAWRGWTIANPERANAPDKYAAITRIPIVDQIAGDLLPATGRRQLVGDPFRRWMRGNAEPQDLSPAMGLTNSP